MRRHSGSVGVLFLLFLCSVLIGCNMRARDKLLRTFIDGVPAPKEEKPAIAGSGAEKEKKEAKGEPELPKAPAPFVHPPFLENQCDSCHDSKSSQRLVSKGKELCFTCHDDFTKDKKVVHYPVSEGDCVGCHDPHQSPNKFMLKKVIPELCFTCHDEKDIKAVSAHEGQSVCAECHNVHASNEEKLLK